MGSINKPFYRVIAIDSRARRDGRYLDNIGYYDPKHNPAKVELDAEKAIKWLNNGAQPTETVRSLFRKVGILKRWHELKYNNGVVIEVVKTKKDEPTKKVAKPKAKKEVVEVEAKEEVVIEAATVEETVIETPPVEETVVETQPVEEAVVETPPVEETVTEQTDSNTESAEEQEQN